MSSSLYLVVLLSAFLHAAWNTAAKKVSGQHGVYWLGQAFAAVALLPVAMFFYTPSVLTPAVLMHIAFCGVVQAIYFTLLAKAYALGDLSVVYPIARGSAVAFTAIAALLFLDEPISGLGALGISGVCAGSAALGLARFSARDRSALIYALLIGLTLVSGSINDKLAVGIVHPVFYIWAMFAVAAIIAAPMHFLKNRAAVTDAWENHKKDACIVGFGALLGYGVILFAFQHGPVSYIVALREMSVVLGSLVGFFHFGEKVTRVKALGIAAITAGIIVIKMA